MNAACLVGDKSCSFDFDIVRRQSQMSKDLNLYSISLKDDIKDRSKLLQ